jgi:sortase A
MSRLSRSPVTGRRPILAWVERGFYAAALLLLGIWTVTTVETHLYGYFQERRLAQMIESRHVVDAAAVRPPSPSQVPARPAAPGPPARPAAVPARISDEDLVGRIEIPRLQLRAIIAEGIGAGTLRRAVGHLPGTPLPGDDGNVVLAGHRDTFFRALKDVRADDVVRITTPRGRFEYVVLATAVVEPTRTDVLQPTAEPSITLVTCYPFYLIGEAPDRFIVRGRLLRTDDSD